MTGQVGNESGVLFDPRAGFSELVVSVQEGREPNLDQAGLDGVEQVLDGALQSLEGLKQVVQVVREVREESAKTLRGRIEQLAPEVGDVSLLGAVLNSNSDSAPVPVADTQKKESSTPPKKKGAGRKKAKRSVKKAASPPSSDEAPSDDEFVHSDESRFILDTLASTEEPTLQRSDFNRAGFNAIKDRSTGAQDQAFRTGIIKLIDAGLLEKVGRGEYSLTDRGEKAAASFLD